MIFVEILSEQEESRTAHWFPWVLKDLTSFLPTLRRLQVLSQDFFRLTDELRNIEHLQGNSTLSPW